MNKKLIASAMVAAGLFSVTGAAQAFGPRGGDSALDDVKAIVELRALDELQVTNIAVNTAEIDGSLVIKSTKGNVTIVGNEGHLSTDISFAVDVETGGRRNDADSDINVTLEPILEAKLVGNNQLSTAAYGAVNAVTVDIDAAQMASVSAAGFELDVEAERSARRSWRNSSFELDIEVQGARGSAESLNPTASALQVAYNNADIDASITVEAAAGLLSSGDVSIANTDMSTTAFGALNQATVAISVAPATLPAVSLGR